MLCKTTFYLFFCKGFRTSCRTNCCRQISKNRQFYLKISGLLMNQNFWISLETYFTITYKQIKKNQEKIKFHIVGANFHENLHLPVHFAYYSTLNTSQEFIFVDVVFLSFNFFFRCLFFLSFYIFFLKMELILYLVL